MCACTNIYIHTYNNMHATYKHKYIHIIIYTHVCVCVLCVSMCVVCAHVLRIYVRMCVHACVCVCKITEVIIIMDDLTLCRYSLSN